MASPDFDILIGPDHPERRLAVAHAHRLSRDGLATLFALDERLGSIVARTQEPGIGLVRLVWWRDALAALDRAPPPAEPLLAAAAALRPDRIAGRELAAMADGWEALFDDIALGSETAILHARERGARLFGLAGRVLGREEERLSDAGEGWALADLGRHFAPPSRGDALLDLARAPLERAMARRWPGALRPLGMLTALALQDVRHGAEALRPPASRMRLIRLLLHRWTGH
jgi:phytoene synthase